MTDELYGNLRLFIELEPSNDQIEDLNSYMIRAISRLENERIREERIRNMRKEDEEQKSDSRRRFEEYIAQKEVDRYNRYMPLFATLSYDEICTIARKLPIYGYESRSGEDIIRMIIDRYDNMIDIQWIQELLE